MGDFEQSLRDQFGSERNQRIAALEAELATERARADVAEQRLSQEQEAMHSDLRTLLEVLGLPSGAQPKSPHEVMLGAVEEVRKRTAELATERTARRDAEAELARIDKAMDDVDLPTDQDDFRLTRAGRLAALKDWWRDYAECTQKAISRAEAAEAQVVALQRALRQIKDVCQHVSIAAAYREGVRDLPHDDSHIEGLDEPPERKSRLYTTAEYAALRDELAAAVAAKEAAEAELARLRNILRPFATAADSHDHRDDNSSHAVGLFATVRQLRAARSALTTPSAGIARAQQLEEQNRLAHELLQRIDETEASDKPMPACVDRQNAAYEVWRTVVEKVGEE